MMLLAMDYISTEFVFIAQTVFVLEVDGQMLRLNITECAAHTVDTSCVGK